MSSPTLDQTRNLRVSSPDLPTELTSLNTWVVAGIDKIPLSPATLARADTTNPTTWSSFTEAARAARRRAGLRLGFVFTKAGGLVGIDLDDCRDPETGEIAAWAWRIVRLLTSYTEISASGTGLHIIIRAPLPPGRRRRGKIEMYDEGRHFVMTGDTLPGFTEITERSTEVAELHGETFGEPTPALPPIPAAPLRLDDRDLLERCRRSPRFCRLYDDGDAGEYGGDESSADLGLLNMLVRAGATDPGQLERLFDDSALGQREKWRRRGDYRARTIARALDGTVTPFPGPTPQVAGLLPPSLAATGTDDASPNALPDDIATLKRMIVTLTRRVEAADRRAEQAEARAAAAESRAATLSMVQSRTTGIVRNNKLRQERFTAVALSYQFANREAAGDTGDNGLYPIPLARVAEAAGVSEDTASKHIATLAEAGVIRKITKWVPEQIDQDGVITGGHKRQFIGPVGNVVDFIDAVANLEPKRTKKDGSPDEGWGGARPRCPDHPDARVILRTTRHCAECDRELGVVDEQPEEAGTRRNPHVADLDPPVANVYRSRNGAPSHNGDLAHNEGPPPGSIAAAWQAGQALPGFGALPPAPPDRYTDITHGGRAS